MEKIVSFIRSAWYNIVHDRLYSVFYVLGTAIAFIFIIILLQAMSILKEDAAPHVHSSRSIYISPELEIGGGKRNLSFGNFFSIFDQVDNIESVYLIDIESTYAVIDEKVRPASVGFVTPEYFEINDFDFIEGKPFVDISSKHAVITKDIADKYYDSNALGEKIEIQNVAYEIVGVVDNYSSLTNPLETAKIWVSIQYNRFVPSGNRDNYSYVVLFPEEMSADDMKTTVKHAIETFYSKFIKGDNTVNINQFRTVQEVKESLLGGDTYYFTTMTVLILLLLIPALNIMTLSMSNIFSRSKEISLRRALGATRLQSFIQIITENFILVLTGLLVALLLVTPVMKFIESMFFDLTAEAAFISASSIDWSIICISLFLAMIFTILSGGIPAYLMSRKNISSELKGREL